MDTQQPDISEETRAAIGTLLGMHDAAPSSDKKPPPSATLNSADETDFTVGSEADASPSKGMKRKAGKTSGNAPVKKRRYQKRGTQEDATPIEGMSELEKKRLASRISSRRTREREKMRGEYFRTIRKKLEKKNKKLRDENVHILNLILKTKKEIDAAKEAKETAPNPIQPLILNQLLTKKPHAQPTESSSRESTANAVLSTADVPPPSQSNTAPAPGQDQLLQMLLQHLSSGNQGNQTNSQQSLSNPALIALIVAMVQKLQGPSSQGLSADLLQTLFQAVCQQQTGSQNSVLQQLLPLLLMGQDGNNQQMLQGLLQILPLLLGSGQNKEHQLRSPMRRQGK
mmetsp:Transcript_9909/g.17545  ORF Transcript_9909/g.17545 Transcript_9909/m.17545 type:complete len:342 (+) Transcript_9909:641-1666(+)